MSDLQFNITAKDQASRVVTQVQKKVTQFGTDIGRSITSMLGPIALITAGVAAITSKFQEMSQKAKDAFDWGAGLQATAGRLGVTVEEFQRLQEIAEQTGEPIDKVAKAFKEAGRVLAEAKTGNEDAAKGLAALGFTAKDLEKLKPQDIVKALGDALASIESPTDKARAAFALFNTEGKNLIETLEKIRKFADKPKSDVLSDEEARFLAVVAKQEKDAADRERLRLAREQATERFLETDEGKRIVERERAAQRRLAPAGAGMPGAGGLSASGFLSVTQIAKSKEIQDEVQARLAALFKAEDKKDEPTPAATAAGKALAALGAEMQKPVEKPKMEVNKVERPQFAVSSLRSIGGGMAGEMATAADIAYQQVDLQRAANKLLEDIKTRLPGTPVDQTKYGIGVAPGAMTPATAGSLAVNT